MLLTEMFPLGDGPGVGALKISFMYGERRVARCINRPQGWQVNPSLVHTSH